MNENINKIKEYIEKVKEYIEYGLEYSEYLDLSNSFDEILNLLEKKDKDIRRMQELLDLSDANNVKKDKIIDLMAEQLTTPIHSKEWVINYYEREIEEDK